LFSTHAQLFVVSTLGSSRSTSITGGCLRSLQSGSYTSQLACTLGKLSEAQMLPSNMLARYWGCTDKSLYFLVVANDQCILTLFIYCCLLSPCATTTLMIFDQHHNLACDSNLQTATQHTSRLAPQTCTLCADAQLLLWRRYDSLHMELHLHLAR
jgi:hypothetical protein